MHLRDAVAQHPPACEPEVERVRDDEREKGERGVDTIALWQSRSHAA
jgi:hypothetical protein